MGVKLYRTNEIRGLKTGLKKYCFFFTLLVSIITLRTNKKGNNLLPFFI